MNKKELSQLYYLNREIEEQQRRLQELDAGGCADDFPAVEDLHGRRYCAKFASLPGRSSGPADLIQALKREDPDYWRALPSSAFAA